MIPLAVALSAGASRLAVGADTAAFGGYVNLYWCNVTTCVLQEILKDPEQFATAYWGASVSLSRDGVSRRARPGPRSVQSHRHAFSGLCTDCLSRRTPRKHPCLCGKSLYFLRLRRFWLQLVSVLVCLWKLGSGGQVWGRCRAERRRRRSGSRRAPTL